MGHTAIKARLRLLERRLAEIDRLYTPEPLFGPAVREAVWQCCYGDSEVHQREVEIAIEEPGTRLWIGPEGERKEGLRIRITVRYRRQEATVERAWKDWMVLSEPDYYQALHELHKQAFRQCQYQLEEAT